MMDLGRHAVAVLGAWGAGLALLAGLILQTMIASTRARRALERAENRRG